MKKTAILFSFLSLMLFMACSSSPESKISKLQDMFKEQAKINNDHGYKSKQATQHAIETYQYAMDLALEATTSKEWTNELKEKLDFAINTPFVGKESTLEAVYESDPDFTSRFDGVYLNFRETIK